MRIQQPILRVLASVSFGLLGCGTSASPADGGAIDSGAADVIDVPVAPTDVPRVDAGSALLLTATLSGRQAVPPAYTTAATGTVTFTLSPDRTLLSYMVTHTILLPLSTQLHLGLAGEAGTMLLPMTNSGGLTIGTTGLTSEQARAIVEGRTYVNITSSSFPMGELRGQIVQPGEAVYTARLSADQENPPNTLESSGVAEFLVDPTARRMRFVVHTRGMTVPPTGAHIHTGAAGTNGAVLIDLAEGGSSLATDFLGTRPITAETVADLEAGRWYVNTHSAAMPAGEIRGQILRPGERLFLARMTGAQEVPPVVTMATGALGVIVGADRDRITYEGAVTGMTPTSAHLHAGGVGVIGDVVAPLMMVGGALRGTATLTATGDAGVPLLTGLTAGTVYANVHSMTYTAGEIRGQLQSAPAPTSTP